MSVCYVSFLLKVRTITFDLSCFPHSGVHMFCRKWRRAVVKSRHALVPPPLSNCPIRARLDCILAGRRSEHPATPARILSSTHLPHIKQLCF